MEEDSSHRIKEFWAELPKADEDFLGSIRDWKNVDVALEADVIWLKGFTGEQALSSEIKVLPNIVLYELRNGLLFKKNALVPTEKVRTALLWIPIDKALKLTFPISKNNFFGIDEKVKVNLITSIDEQPAAALLCPFAAIKEIIAAIPKFKLERLNWIVMDDNALFLGTPLLSFPGKTYWMKEGHLLPAGFDFEFKNLSALLQRKYNSGQDQWLLWNEDGSVLYLHKEDFRKLTLSSFRLTEKSKEWM